MPGDRTCPTCRVIAPMDRLVATAACPACHTRFPTELATEIAVGRQPPAEPYEGRWLLVLFGIFGCALGLVAVSQIVAFVVWASASVVTIAASRWHLARFERLHPVAELPSAVTVPRRERSRRPLPPA